MLFLFQTSHSTMQNVNLDCIRGYANTKKKIPYCVRAVTVASKVEVFNYISIDTRISYYDLKEYLKTQITFPAV